MNIRERAMVLTGMAFPLGSILGILIGRSTVPASTGGGFGDIVYILMWFILGAPLLTLVVFFWSTRKVEWARVVEKRAFITMFTGVFVATAALMLLLVILGRGGNGAWILLALPVGALIVTLFARKALKA